MARIEEASFTRDVGRYLKGVTLDDEFNINQIFSTDEKAIKSFTYDEKNNRVTLVLNKIIKELKDHSFLELRDEVKDIDGELTLVKNANSEHFYFDLRSNYLETFKNYKSDIALKNTGIREALELYYISSYREEYSKQGEVEVTIEIDSYDKKSLREKNLSTLVIVIELALCIIPFFGTFGMLVKFGRLGKVLRIVYSTNKALDVWDTCTKINNVYNNTDYLNSEINLFENLLHSTGYIIGDSIDYGLESINSSYSSNTYRQLLQENLFTVYYITVDVVDFLAPFGHLAKTVGRYNNTNIFENKEFRDLFLRKLKVNHINSPELDALTVEERTTSLIRTFKDYIYMGEKLETETRVLKFFDKKSKEFAIIDFSLCLTKVASKIVSVYFDLPLILKEFASFTPNAQVRDSAEVESTDAYEKYDYEIEFQMILEGESLEVEELTKIKFDKSKINTFIVNSVANSSKELNEQDISEKKPYIVVEGLLPIFTNAYDYDNFYKLLKVQKNSEVIDSKLKMRVERYRALSNEKLETINIEDVKIINYTENYGIYGDSFKLILKPSKDSLRQIEFLENKTLVNLGRG